jgi:hypothetical protein
MLKRAKKVWRSEMMRAACLLPLLLCLSVLTGCAGGTLFVPWPPLPTSVILSPTPRPTIDAAIRLTETPLPTPAPSVSKSEVYSTALRLDGLPSAKTTGMTEYRLDVTVAPDLSEITGQAHVRYTNREAVPLDVVYLHLYPNLWDGGMTVTEARVNGAPVETTYPAGDDVIGLPLAAPLPPGESVELALNFSVPVPSGDGVGNYGEFALQEGVLALAHFYPTVAVYDTDWRLETPAPHGDVIFQDASLYDVTLTAPADLTVVATGATLGKTANADGSATWRLGGGPMRDFNVVASRDYLSASTQVGDMTVNSYFLPGDEEGGRQALDWAAQALTIYQKEFGAYPYRELDVVETGTSAGGIEYPGLIAVASRLYSDPKRQAFFESATVHEVGHQWWYNVVGNDQLNHPWLDEALTQYATYRYFQNAYGEAGGQGFIDSLNGRWAAVGRDEKPIGLPGVDYAAKEYGAIVYGRGPLFFLALRDRLGADKMTELLRRYYAEQAWDIATPEELRALAEEVAGESLADLWAEWVEP